MFVEEPDIAGSRGDVEGRGGGGGGERGKETEVPFHDISDQMEPKKLNRNQTEFPLPLSELSCNLLVNTRSFDFTQWAKLKTK